MVNNGTMLANCAVITTVSLALAKEKDKKTLFVLLNVKVMLMIPS